MRSTHRMRHESSGRGPDPGGFPLKRMLRLGAAAFVLTLGLSAAPAVRAEQPTPPTDAQKQQMQEKLKAQHDADVEAKKKQIQEQHQKDVQAQQEKVKAQH